MSEKLKRVTSGGLLGSESGADKLRSVSSVGLFGTLSESGIAVEEEDRFRIRGHSRVMVYFQYTKGTETSCTLSFETGDVVSEKYYPVTRFTGGVLVPVRVKAMNSGMYRVQLTGINRFDTSLKVIRSYEGSEETVPEESEVRVYVDSPYLNR